MGCSAELEWCRALEFAFTVLFPFAFTFDSGPAEQRGREGEARAALGRFVLSHYVQVVFRERLQEPNFGAWLFMLYAMGMGTSV